MAAIDYGNASAVNSFMTSQANAPYLANLPDYAKLLGLASQNTESLMRGVLPLDEQQSKRQEIAQWASGQGINGSPAQISAYQRALGIGSLQAQQQGFENLSKLRADTPTAELVNPWSLYVPQTLADQSLAAAKAGQRAGGGVGGDGISYGGGGGLPATSAIPRTNTGGIVQGGGGQLYGTGTANPNLYTNWQNTYGGMNLNSSNAGGVIQNDFTPNWYDSASSAMSSIPTMFGGGDWWNTQSQLPQTPDWGNDMSQVPAGTGYDSGTDTMTAPSSDYYDWSDPSWYN